MFSTAIGLAIIGYIILVLGLFGLLYKWICLVLISLLLIFSLWNLTKSRYVIIENIRKIPKYAMQIKEKKFEAVLLFMLFVYFILNLFISLSPPIDLDSLVYHLAIPKIWIQNHKIIYIPFILASEMPLMTETLYALGMMLTSEISAGLIIWAFGLLLALSIISFCKDNFSYQIGLLASSALCFTALFINTSTRTLVDIVTTFYAFLGFYAFINYIKNDERKWLILCSLMCGFSASTKHSGLIPFIILFIMIFITEIRRRKLNGIKNIVLCGVVFFAIPLIWYIKSFINTGNPTVIYFTKIFGGRNLLPKDMSTLVVSWRSLYGFDNKSLNILVLPLRLLASSFFTGPDYWHLGAFIIAFVPILVFIRKIDKPIKYLLLYSLSSIILFSVVTSQTRLAMPAYVGLFIVGSYSAYRIFDYMNNYKSIIQIIIIASLIINADPLINEVIKRFPVAVGLENREDYIKRRVETYKAIEYANHNLNKDSKVLTMDARGFHFDIPYIVGSPNFQGFIIFDNISSISQLSDMIKEKGITHILTTDSIAESVIPFWNELKNNLIPLYSSGNLYLYNVSSI
jgi:hypothetical protein